MSLEKVEITMIKVTTKVISYLLFYHMTTKGVINKFVVDFFQMYY